MSSWKIVGAAVRGPDHEEDRSPCQDAFCHLAEGRRLVAAIADGAGSARHSDEGAQRLCDFLVQELAACGLPLSADDADTNKWLERAADAIAMVRDEFRYRASVSQDADDTLKLRDYAATLVAVVAEPEGGLFLHIGDGAGAAVHNGADWSEATLSAPENGEFANETYFFTGDDWRQRLRLTRFDASDLIVLLSDGAMSFTLADKLAGLEARFMAPVTKFLDSVDAAAGAQALAHTLNRDDARRISGDDKTLVWIRHETAA